MRIKIKYLLVLFFISSLPLKHYAQQYGNEWINYSQKYYKIKLVKDGVYRITYSDLIAAGVPVSTFNPKNLQLFGRTNEPYVQEQYIYVHGDNDNSFDNGDYIEFYGQHNDGRMDSTMYINTQYHPNPYYSLVNDTAAYFLTWNNSTSNLRTVFVSDTASSTYTPADYFINELKQYGTSYFIGETYSSDIGVTDPEYAPSEGYFNAAIYNGDNSIMSFNTTNIFTGGPDATYRTVVVGASQKGFPNDHHIEIKYSDKNSIYNLLKDTSFTGYQTHRFDTTLVSSTLGSITNVRYTSIPVTGVNYSRTAISYGVLRYPHTFDLESANNYIMYLPDDGFQSQSYLKITNFSSAAADSVFVYDLTNHKRIKTVKSGSNVKALVPNGTGIKWCYITSVGQMNSAVSITPVGNAGTFTNYKSLSVDSAYLIVTHKSLLSEVLLEYKPYRESVNGGSHNVVVADVDELYDQFAFGIDKHPFSIRNFSKFTVDSFISPPQYLFLIGKSLHLHDTPGAYRTNPFFSSKCLVPSFGEPPSDILFTSQLNNTKLYPAIPTGRLSANTPAEVAIYLDKVKEYEGNAPEEWMKNVLHFAGGGDISLSSYLKSFLNKYKGIIEGPYWGANVTTFTKDNSLPISINTSDSLKKFIEDGVSMMTFFGHSSGQSWDVGIDDPANYNNKRKYPFILSLGCYAGDIHSYDIQRSNSENFVILKDKGAIGFLAAVSLGIPDRLDIYTTYLEQNFSKFKYGKPIAKNIQAVIDSFERVHTKNDLLNKACMLEMTFHGDPAVSLNAPQLPDYAITTTDVKFDTDWKTDSFKVFIVHTNLGRALDTTYQIYVERNFPGGKKTTYDTIVKAPMYKDTLVLKMPFDFINGVGVNKFKVVLDNTSLVAESLETNNSISPDAELVIKGNDIVPVYPYKYAIIPNNTVTLKASTVNPFAPSVTYRIQMDTTDSYNSPFFKQTTVTSAGGVITWTPPVTLTDSAVWYWRVSADSLDTVNTFNWHESSFQYITGKRGWGQAHFFQFKKDEYEFVKYNKPQRKYDFFNTYKNIQVQTGVWPYASGPTVNWHIDLAEMENSPCGGTNWIFGVMDSVSITPMVSKKTAGPSPGYYGDVHCKWYRDAREFDFYANTTVQRTNIKNFIDSIPKGSYVVAFNPYLNLIDTMGGKLELYSTFDKLGSGKIRTLRDSLPYILFGQKGAAPGTAKEVIGAYNSVIKLDTALLTKWKQGYILSEMIGPAYSWDSLFWRKRSVEGVVTDVDTIQIIGIKNDGTKTVLYTSAMNAATDMRIDAIADASVYPYLQLKALMQDDVNSTPTQMVRWQVIYAPVPEAAVNQLVGSGYSFYNDTLSEGDNVKFVYPIQNISEYSFTDSLLVTSWVQNKNGYIVPLPSRLKKKPFAPDEVIMDTIVTSTATLQGLNTIFAEVNPVGQTRSQLEQYHFNNLASANFFVSGDRINPLLDVTFDGIHILNGDIVSAKPNILVQLKDENKFLALNSMSDFNCLLKKPTDAQAQPITNDLSFTAAILPNNSCKINYTPTFVQDGVYELIIQAKDRSGNISGQNDFKIKFEVVTRSTITNVMNYPNPFSTSTHFVFTLTGSEIPDNLKIQILTITGKVVREITKDELGPIHIGRNITEYAWDGKDEFGDQLANGVYLYRAQTYLNGSSIEKRDSGADKFFNKEFGKMYLMR